MKTIGTLFSGGELVGVGARNAGLKHLWGVEYKDEIAAVARLNGFNTITADVTKIDPRSMEVPDVLHASTVCTRASQANSDAELNEEGTKEHNLDIESAEAVVTFINVMRPKVFTLENVYAYRKFKSFNLITSALSRHGYMWDYDNCNSADYGILVECPIHANSVKRNSLRETAPDIVNLLAMMSSEGQVRHLAYDAAVNLVKATQRDTAVGAAWQSLESADRSENQIRIGRVENTLTIGGISELESMENIDANIALLLKVCLDAPLIVTKSSIIKTETKLTILLRILSSLKTTGNTCTSINSSEENCPLCRFESVPQIRRRLVLRATLLGLLPHLPAPELPWRGWYQAIEDLIPTLPDSEFAPWQLQRMPDEMRTFIMVTGNTNLIQDKAGGGVCFEDEPTNTITAISGGGMPKAYLYAGQNTISNVTRRDIEPAPTIAAFQKGGSPVAFILGQGERSSPIESDKPSQTITGNSNQTGVRAFIVDDQNGGGWDKEERGLTIREEGQPMFTVSASQSRRSLRPAVNAGRVVSMTPRALARFQALPDSYLLPEKNGLACLIIGNGVPPLMYEKIIRQMI